MLTALLFLAGATIDYQTVAKPLPEVLKELSALSGVEMLATDALASERLVIRVEDVAIGKLRSQIATAVLGKWAEKDGVFLISVDQAAAKNLENFEIEKHIRYFADTMDYVRAPKETTPSDQWGRIQANADAGQRLLCELIDRIDLETLVRLEFWETVTYSDQPTRMQRPLANARGALYRYLEKHNEMAAALQKDVPEVEVGTEQQQALKAAAKTWQGPLRAVLKCLRGTGFVYVECHIYDRNGNRVANPSITLSGRRFFRLPDGLPDYNHADPVPLSSTSRELARLFYAGNSTSMRDGSFGLSPSAFDALITPTKFDPLTFHLSETIIGYGQGSGLQLVAAVDERMIAQLQSETPTLGQIGVALFYSDVIHPHLEDGWLTISRSRLPFEGFDYAVLERLFAATKKRTPTLIEMIEFANSAPHPLISILASVYAYLLLRDGMIEPDLRTGLLAFGALSAQEREKLMQGDAIVFSSLSRESQSALQNSLFFRNGQSVDVAPSYLERNPGSPVWLPSDIVPNGIPPQARITLRSKAHPQALPIPKAPGRLAGSVTSPRWMAIYATTKASGEIPKYDNFWVGERIDYDLNVQVSPEITMTLKFYENKILMTGETYNIQTAPKEFRDEYNKTVDERIRLQGGGG